jgi:hypothetical protein
LDEYARFLGVRWEVMYTVTGGRKARRLSVPVQKQTEKQQQESRGERVWRCACGDGQEGETEGREEGGRTSGLCSEIKLHVSCACLRERVNVSVGWLLSELLELQEFGVHFQHVVAEKRDGSAWPTPFRVPFSLHSIPQSKGTS